MGLTMTSAIRRVQQRTGFPRFKLVTEDEIKEQIVSNVIPEFTHYFPYKTYFAIYPSQDAVDDQKYPGLFKIVPKDCDISKIYDVGMCFEAGSLAVGGYPRDALRNVYGSFGFGGGPGAVLYAQLHANIASMTQVQQITCEYIQPNLVQIYPKRRNWVAAGQQIVIELLVYHSEDLKTIPNSYEQEFLKMAVLYTKALIYDKYKDLDAETYAGHQVRTMVQAYSDSEDKIEDLKKEWDEEYVFNPDRLDFYVV